MQAHKGGNSQSSRGTEVAPLDWTRTTASAVCSPPRRGQLAVGGTEGEWREQEAELVFASTDFDGVRIYGL